jgi:hypothetical protein
MVNQPPKPPPPQPPKQHQPPPPPPRHGEPVQSRYGEPAQPLQPPLPPAQSSPPRQPAPDPPPHADEPHDQRNPTREDHPDVAVALNPEQATGILTTPQPPVKYRRPLPQPGDNDYVAGQPVNEEEAQRVEQEQQERYDRAQNLVRDAEARWSPASGNPPPQEQHPGSLPPRTPGPHVDLGRDDAARKSREP